MKIFFKFLANDVTLVTSWLMLKPEKINADCMHACAVCLSSVRPGVYSVICWERGVSPID